MRFLNNEIAESRAFDYIEVFCNRQRRHSAIGYISPAEFERAFTERQAA